MFNSKEFCFVSFGNSEEELKKALLFFASAKRLHGSSEFIFIVAEGLKTKLTDEAYDQLSKKLDIKVLLSNSSEDHPSLTDIEALKTNAGKLLISTKPAFCLNDINQYSFSKTHYAARSVEFEHQANEIRNYIYPVFNKRAQYSLTSVSGKIIEKIYSSNILYCQNANGFLKLFKKFLKTADLNQLSDDEILNTFIQSNELDVETTSNKELTSLLHRTIDKINPAICLYENITDLLRNKSTYPAIAEILSEHPQFYTLFDSNDDQFASKSLALVKKGNISEHITPESILDKNFLITGMPRSGSSLLTRILDDQNNMVVINEPEYQIFDLLRINFNPNWLDVFIADHRLRIECGLYVQNKIAGDKVIADTIAENKVSTYVPSIENEEFFFGVKDNLDFLSIIHKLPRIYSHLKILACVRHPYDCTASWIKSFRHLKTVDLGHIGYLNDQHRFTIEQLNQLEQINSLDDMSVKRALFWNFIAEIILSNQDKVTVVKYEDWFSEPQMQYRKIAETINYPVDKFNTQTIELKPSTKSSILTEHDRKMIKTFCSSNAGEFGYIL